MSLESVQIEQLLLQIAEHTTSKEALGAALLSGRREMTHAAALNKTLTAKQWDTIYDAEDYELTLALASHHLDDPRVITILNLNIPEITRTLFGNALSEISPRLQDELIKYHITPTLAHQWLTCIKNQPDSELKRRLAEIENGYWALRLLASTALYSDEQALLRVDQLKDSYSGRGHNLAALLDERPSLIQPTLGLSRKNILTAVAGSRHVFANSKIFEKVLSLTTARNLTVDELLEVHLTLMANPNTPKDVIVQAATSFKAALFSLGIDPYTQTSKDSGQYRPNIKAYYEVEKMIASNSIPDPVEVDWLTDPPEQSNRIKNAVFNLLSIHSYPTYIELFTKSNSQKESLEQQEPFQLEIPNSATFLTLSEQLTQGSLAQFLASRVDPVLDQYGVQGWEVLFTMAPTWQASISSLLDVICSLVKKQ